MIDLVDSYMRRQIWLQRTQAVQVVNAYAEAMTPRSAGDSRGSSDGSAQAAPSHAGLRVGGDTMLRMLGAKGL